GPAGYWFAGEVNIDMPAYFLPFACHWDFLRQVAALNLEFFHLRFVLDRLLDLQGETVFIALVKSRIAGMMAVDIKSRLFYHGLEISHIATVGENRTDIFAASLPELRGVGSFLVAGLWLLWKQGFFKADEIVLDSEIESRGFYKTLGFELRRQVSFVLRRPSTSLLASILSLLESAPGLEAAVAEELEKLIRGEIDRLAQQKGRALSGWPRAKTLRLLAGLLQSQALDELRRSAWQRILQKRNRIPEAEELLAMSQEPLPVPATRASPLQEPQLLIVRDDRFLDHLSGIFHLESPNRLKEIHTLLDEPAISRRCQTVKSREAVIKELMWVHSREYIQQVALTAKQRVSFLDADTQTTPGSYQTACLAAGSVFNLLERLMAGHNARGFAFVRPPGHHATRSQGMGFCLFNNAALGARYLQERFGLQRILILDLDAHHGNGIQEAFYDTDRVLYISLHQFPAYPGTGNYGETGQGSGEGFTVNVPLPSGQGDLVFARIIQQFVRPLALTYQPEIILVPFGFDVYSHDRLAGMKVTPEGYGLITSILLDIAAQCDQGRIAFILEGGYSVKGVRSCALKVLQELCGLSNTFPEKQALLCLRQLHQMPVLKKVLEVQKAYWHCLL
ncbi:MAG: histone deacetylase, partial [Desulfohalobiaceae bacterium]|nr:histone deacetylase [Desulfohalobiaceae bacterium]